MTKGPQRRGLRKKSGRGEHAPRLRRAPHYAVSAHGAERKNRNFLVYLQHKNGGRIPGVFSVCRPIEQQHFTTPDRTINDILTMSLNSSQAPPRRPLL
jgi:hypothetical protein